MTLFEEIQAKCTPTEIASGDHIFIANKVSQGRTIAVATEVGNGTILEVLGLDVGNALLDLLYTQTNFRYVKPLLEQGRLRLDSALVQSTLDSLVGQQISATVTFTATHASALKARCLQPAPVSAQEVAYAIEQGA